MTVKALAREWQKRRALAVGTKLVADPFVWSGSFDGASPYRPDTVTRRFGRLRRRVTGAEAVRLHDLRHFVATRLRASGLDLTTVAGYVGHRDETTTARSYAHPLDEALRDAAEVMARLVGEPTARWDQNHS